MRTLPRHRRHVALTLIEVAAVVLIVGLLASLATVSVLSSRTNNEQTQARQSIEAVTFVQVEFARRYGTFTAWPDDLSLPEGPELTTGVSRSERTVSVAVAADGTLGMASGTGGSCVLRTVEPLLRDAAVQDRAPVDREGCSATSALSGKDLTTPTSRIPGSS